MVFIRTPGRLVTVNLEVSSLWSPWPSSFEKFLLCRIHGALLALTVVTDICSVILFPRERFLLLILANFSSHCRTRGDYPLCRLSSQATHHPHHSLCVPPGMPGVSLFFWPMVQAANFTCAASCSGPLMGIGQYCSIVSPNAQTALRREGESARKTKRIKRGKRNSNKVHDLL